MMDQGADVFFGDASAVDSGARQAIDEANKASGSIKVYDIGQPSDLLGQNECVICSQVTDNSSLVGLSMTAVEEGKFGGEVIYGTLQNGVLSAGKLNDLVPKDVQEKYLAYIDQMVNDTFMK
jgi:basic membrane protein A